MPAAAWIREWAAGASLVAQLAATAAGMLPWWALPLTAGLTLVVARPQPPSENRNPILRNLAVGAVGAFAVLIAFRTVAAGRVGADPVATLRSLTEALVILSLIMAPAARTPREYRVWLTVTTGVLVAAAAGGHSTSSHVLSIASWIVLLLAMARVQTAATFEGDAVLAHPPATAAPAGIGSRLWSGSGVVPVIASLTAGLVVFFALPSGLGGGDLAKRVAHHVDEANQGAPVTRATAGVDTSGAGDLSLLVRGDLPTTPLLRVPLHSPQLWRGTFYSTYTGSSWTTSHQPVTFALPGVTTVPPSTDDPRPSGVTRTYSATLLNSFNESLLWAPGVPEQVSGTADASIEREPSNVRVNEVRQGLAPEAQPYVVTAAVATTSPARLSRASGTTDVAAKWTQLPAELPTRVGALARQVTAGATSRYAEVVDLELYLRSHETYLLNSPVPSPGEDAVDAFLFHDHVGFCEQFASAEAVMLRTLGVPTRLVSGLAYGKTQGDTRLLTGADAHAWVEVWYPGIGWSPTDPTAGVALAPTPTAHESAITRAVNAVIGAVPGGRIVLVAIILLLVVGGGLLGRSRPGERRARRGDRPRTGPVLTAFLRATGPTRGPAPRAPSETAREYVGRVSPPGELEAAVRTLEQEVYGSAPPGPDEAENAVAAFGELGRSGRRTPPEPRRTSVP